MGFFKQNFDLFFLLLKVSIVRVLRSFDNWRFMTLINKMGTALKGKFGVWVHLQYNVLFGLLRMKKGYLKTYVLYLKKQQNEVLIGKICALLKLFCLCV